MGFYTFGDKHPDIYKVADKYIPLIWGSLREAWMKGYLGAKVKYVKTSATAKFYKMGKQSRKERRS